MLEHKYSYTSVGNSIKMIFSHFSNLGELQLACYDCWTSEQELYLKTFLYGKKMYPEHTKKIQIAKGNQTKLLSRSSWMRNGRQYQPSDIFFAANSGFTYSKTTLKHP